MKFTSSQSELNSNLSLVSRAVASRPTHPVLGNVLFCADEEKGENFTFDNFSTIFSELQEKPSNGRSYCY